MTALFMLSLRTVTRPTAVNPKRTLSLIATLRWACRLNNNDSLDGVQGTSQRSCAHAGVRQNLSFSHALRRYARPTRPPANPPGQTFDKVIERALAAAHCVVVVRSRAAVASRWVRTEADEGLQGNVRSAAMRVWRFPFKHIALALYTLFGRF